MNLCYNDYAADIFISIQLNKISNTLSGSVIEPGLEVDPVKGLCGWVGSSTSRSMVQLVGD